MEIFARASKQKLRFDSTKGQLSTEDLWDLSLQSLDNLAKGVNRALKATQEESFIEAKTTANTELELKLDILKEIIADKLKAKAAATARAEKQAKLSRLKELMANKEDEALAGKSIEELQKMVAELDVDA
jgi:hypothetical protein